MSQKNKKSKGKAESANKKRVLLRLQKHEAYSEETAKTLKEVGLGDTHRYERHLEQLIAEGYVKQEDKSDITRYWVVKNKVVPKKGSGYGNMLLLWLGSSVVVLVIIIIIFGGG